MPNIEANNEKDFHVEVRVKNARILRAMKRVGIKTFRELSRLSMVDVQRLGEIVSFKRRPIAHGDWSDAALGISAALRCDPEELWPEHMKHLHTKKSFVSFETDDPTMNEAALAAPTTMAFLADSTSALARSMETLTPRERLILDRYYKDSATLDDIGVELGVTRERIREIKEKALRKLRHPKRAKYLASLLEYTL